MKQITKTLLASALSLGIVFSLVACGSSNEEVSEEPTVSEIETEKVTEIEINPSEEEEIDEDVTFEDEIPKFTNKTLKTVTKYGIDGTVIQIDEYNTEGTIVRSIYDEYEETFDKEGNSLDIIYYDNEDTIIPERTYNENGDILTVYYPDSSYHEYFYNNEGILTREDTWRTLNAVLTDEIMGWYLSDSFKYEYASDNSSYGEYYWSCPYFVAGPDDPYVISHDITDDEWKVITYSEYTYDENGNLETEHIYSGENIENLSLVDYYMYSYYDNGNLKEKKTYNSNLSLTQYTEYNYTDNGYTETIYDGDDTLEREIKYNTNGDVLHDVSYDSKGNVDNEITNTYWSNGELKTNIKYESGSKSIEKDYDYCGNIIFDSSNGDTCQYEYDEAGNKIYEKIISNGSTTEYTYTNEYYE